MKKKQWQQTNAPCYIIAEVSANHAGSKEYAKEIIHVAKEAGADCVKLQTYTPDTMTISCNSTYFKVNNGTWKGENLYNLYQKAYTPWEWQAELKEEADKIGLDFLSTPFDRTAVDFLETIQIDSYKIASFELVDLPLLSYVASKGKPIILSTGMGTLKEIQAAVDTIKINENIDLALLKCSSAYPAISEEMNLKTMMDMKHKFQLPVGLSDHTLGTVSAVTAVALGASIIEKHICISRSIETPDSSFSMEPNELEAMIYDIREAEKALGRIHYGPTNEEKESLIFRRSIFAVKDIHKGEILTEDNIKIIRPGYGLAPKYYKNLLGKQTEQEIPMGTPITKNIIPIKFEE